MTAELCKVPSHRYNSRQSEHVAPELHMCSNSRILRLDNGAKLISEPLLGISPPLHMFRSISALQLALVDALRRLFVLFLLLQMRIESGFQ